MKDARDAVSAQRIQAIGVAEDGGLGGLGRGPGGEAMGFDGVGDAGKGGLGEAFGQENGAGCLG